MTIFSLITQCPNFLNLTAAERTQLAARWRSGFNSTFNPYRVHCALTMHAAFEERKMKCLKILPANLLIFTVFLFKYSWFQTCVISWLCGSSDLVSGRSAVQHLDSTLQWFQFTVDGISLYTLLWNRLCCLPWPTLADTDCLLSSSCVLGELVLCGITSLKKDVCTCTKFSPRESGLMPLSEGFEVLLKLCFYVHGHLCLLILEVFRRISHKDKRKISWHKNRHKKSDSPHYI